MRYKASESEISSLATMAHAERLNYFLTRTMEAEEIWSLGNADGWELQERDGRTLVPLWPYRELADMNIPLDTSSASPQATSLDHFFQNVLPVMIKQQIDIEVIGMPETPGRIIAASDLYALMESMLESGEYYIEG